MSTSIQRPKALKTTAKATAKTTAQTVAKPRASTAKPPSTAPSPVSKARAAKSTAQTQTVAPKAAAPVVQTPVKAAKLAETAKSKAAKKPKLVRDSFTMPKDEYQAIDSLKTRATRLQRSAKKSELLRAGIMALSAMDDKAFAAALAQVPALKTGRPGRA